MSWDCRVFTSEAVFQRYLLVGGLVFSVMSLPLFNEFCELRRVPWLRNIISQLETQPVTKQNGSLEPVWGDCSIRGLCDMGSWNSRRHWSLNKKILDHTPGQRWVPSLIHVDFWLRFLIRLRVFISFHVRTPTMNKPFSQFTDVSVAPKWRWFDVDLFCPADPSSSTWDTWPWGRSSIECHYHDAWQFVWLDVDLDHLDVVSCCFMELSHDKPLKMSGTGRER